MQATRDRGKVSQGLPLSSRRAGARRVLMHMLCMGLKVRMKVTSEEEAARAAAAV